jgi:hypothetical protein
MKVGWLYDDPGYLGGAEMTQAEFRAAAPKGVEVVDCRPGNVVSGLDRYVIHNCVHYSGQDLAAADGPRVKYLNDVWPDGDPLVRREVLSTAHVIFTSPLHRERFYSVPRSSVIPPALDLARFRAAKNGHRKGAVCVARLAYGKGLERLVDYPEPVDVFTDLPPEQVAPTLARYARFVFLPTALEPFGRAVVEAWAAGLEVIINRNVGARYFIEEDQPALESASEDFWRVVCG